MGNLPYKAWTKEQPNMLRLRGFSTRGSVATHFGGAPKKSRAPRTLSDTISFGKSASGLTLWSLRGRRADQGEWSEGRTSEEENAPRLEIEAEVQVAKVQAEVGFVPKAFRPSIENSYRQSSQTEERVRRRHQAIP